MDTYGRWVPSNDKTWIDALDEEAGRVTAVAAEEREP